MAQTTANVLIGAATIFLDPYVAAAAPVGSPTEVGHTRGPVTIAPSFTDYEVKSEQAAATIIRSPTDTAFAIKVPMIESTLEHWADAFRQPAANLSGDGSATDKVLRVGLAVEQYHQLKITGKGLGDALTRVVFAWRASVSEVAEIQWTKDNEQMVELNLMCNFDTSVTTADKVMLITDAM